MELALDEAQYQAGLANGRLSQQHQLELADLVGGGGGGAVGPRRSSSPRHASTRGEQAGLTPGLEISKDTEDERGSRGHQDRDQAKRRMEGVTDGAVTGGENLENPQTEHIVTIRKKRKKEKKQTVIQNSS